MTDLKKRLSVSIFAVFALAFCCLIISQAAIARSDRVVKVGSADNVITDRVPLPIVDVRGGPSGAGLSTFDPAEGRLAEIAVGQPIDFATLGKPLRLRPEDDVKATGALVGGGETPATATVIASLPYTDAGVLTTTAVHDYPLDCGFGDPGDYGRYGDIWYKYTATYDAWIEISMCNTDDPYKDFVLGLWEGDPGAGGTMVACDEDACVAPDYGAPHLRGYQLTSGTDYYIQIKAWSMGDGAYVLDMYDPFSWAQANATYTDSEACGDNYNGGCSYGGEGSGWDDAEFIDGCGEVLFGLTFKNAGGTTYPDYRDGDQWRFELTEVNKVAVTFQAELGTAFFMHAYDAEGDCEGQVSLGGFAIPGGYVFENEWVLYPGWYAISVRSHTEDMACGEGPAGDPRYYILTDCVPLTPVDDCGLAREISGDTEPGVPIVQDLCGFTTDGPDVAAYGGSPYYYFNNGWFLWECEETGVYTFSACTSPNVGPDDPPLSHDLFMGVFPEGCPAEYGSELGFNDDGDACPGWEPEVTDVICAEGLFYLITVGVWDPYSGQDCGEVWLEISHTELPLLGNNCATDRLTIEEETWGRFFHNLNATLDGPAETICNANEFGGDIWYEITAWQDGWLYAIFCDVNFDENNELYEGTTCPTNANPLVPYRCADDACPDMSDFNGGYVDCPVQTGDKFLLRVGGWYRIPDYPLSAYGMGYGYFDCFITDQWDTLPVPVNDECKDVTPIALVDGVTDTRTVNQDWMRRDTCHLIHPKHMESEIWEAFTVPGGVCMHVEIDYFGYVDACDDNTRHAIREGEGMVWTGCPCEGDYFAILADRACLNLSSGAACTPSIPGGDFNNYMEWLMLPSGDYFFPHNHWTIGGNCGWGPAIVNLTGTEIECAYCVGESNIGTCTWPAVAGASWIIDVDLADLHKVGVVTVQNDTSDCHSYEDWTDSVDYVAHLYRGIEYTLEFVMGKVGIAGEFDVAGAYVDWNQNAVWFDPGETLAPERVALTWSAPFTVPLDALDPGVGGSGQTRMRIRMGSTADAGQPSYCGSVVWGEVEDYRIEVMDIECGDFDGDDDVDADDIAFIRAYYFGGPGPDYWQRADIDGDGYITIADVIALADAVYRDGPLICL